MEIIIAQAGTGETWVFEGKWIGKKKGEHT